MSSEFARVVVGAVEVGASVLESCLGEDSDALECVVGLS